MEFAPHLQNCFAIAGIAHLLINVDPYSVFKKSNFCRYAYGKLVTGRLEATLCLKVKRRKKGCLTEIKNVGIMLC
jgi:hypothetical protein